MSAGVGIWERIGEAKDQVAPSTESCTDAAVEGRRFADDQILGLVRDLYFTGSQRPAKQVVFSGASEDTGVGELCKRVALLLAAQTMGRIVVVEAGSGGTRAGTEFEGGGTDGGRTPEPARAVHTSSRQIGVNVWQVEGGIWGGDAWGQPTVPWVRRQLGELRRAFEYAVIHAPPVAQQAGASLLAQSADGLVLVIEAHHTRRILAQRLQEYLQNANVHVLGAVLRGRTFPIPERLYRRV